MELENYTLSNGLRLAALKNNSVKSACLLADIYSGGRDDSLERAGEHHSFEHMPYRGTHSFPDKLSWSVPLERYGITGGTGWITPCRTQFPLGFPKDQLSLCATHLSELVYKPLLRSQDWEEERAIIVREQEEHRSNRSHIWQQHFNPVLFSLNQELWAGTLGSADTVQKIQIEHLSAIHGSEYSTENSQLVLAGSFSENWLETLEQTFGLLKLPKGRDGRLKLTAVPLAGENLVAHDEVFKEPAWSTGSWFANPDHRKIVALSIFMKMLGNGKELSGPLFQELRERRKLTYTFGINFQDSLPGLASLSFSSTVNASRTGEMENAFWETVEETMHSRERFCFAKDRRQGQRMMEVFEPQNEAVCVANQLLFDGIYKSDEAWDLIYNGITFEEVAAVARVYFDRSKFSTFLMLP